VLGLVLPLSQGLKPRQTLRAVTLRQAPASSYNSTLAVFLRQNDDPSSPPCQDSSQSPPATFTDGSTVPTCEPTSVSAGSLVYLSVVALATVTFFAGLLLGLRVWW